MSGFVAGMLVHTDRGMRPIEQIEAGDRVLSQHHSGVGPAEYRRVVRATASQADVVAVWFQADKEADPYKAKYALVIAGCEQAFWIEQVGWTSAQDVNRVQVIGAMFRTADGGQTPTGAMNRIYRTDRPEIGWEATLGDQSAGALRDFTRGGAFLESGVYYDVERWAPGEGDDDLYAPFCTSVHDLGIEEFHTYFVGDPGVWVRGALPHRDDPR